VRAYGPRFIARCNEYGNARSFLNKISVRPGARSACIAQTATVCAKGVEEGSTP